MAHDVLTKVAAQSSDGTAELLSKDSVGRTMKRSFVAVPTRRKRLDPTSSPKQQSNFVCEKAKVIGAFVGSHLRADTPHERHIGRRVLNKIAEQFGGTVHNIGYKFKTLDMQEVITLRDIGPKTSSAMVRFVSAFCALRPDLESELGIQIWPKCLQARLTLFESTNNFELKSMKCNVQVKKDDTLYKMRPYAYLVKPWQLLELMVDNLYIDCSFKQSKTWMNPIFKSKVVLTSNLDKGGDDIICTIRLCNRGGGATL